MPDTFIPACRVQKVDLWEILIAPEFPALLEEYATESAIDGLPPPAAKIEQYTALAGSGALHIFSAVKDDQLVGFITVLAPVLPHYGVTVAVTESFFVAPAHRAGGAGLRLLAAAERQARDIGSPVFMVSAPFNGRLAKLLPKCGYTETSRVFMKRLHDA